jgi:hypothetical protein
MLEGLERQHHYKPESKSEAVIDDPTAVDKSAMNNVKTIQGNRLLITVAKLIDGQIN